MDMIKNRLYEPSTWRAVAVLLALVGIQITPEQLDAIGEGFIALIAVLAMIWPERGGEQ